MSEFSMQVRSEVFDANDERWQNQVQVLLEDLRGAGTQVQQNVTPVAGTKGGLSELIIALGSAGVFSAAVSVIANWLRERNDRVIEITTVQDGDKKITRITGKNVSDETLRQALPAHT